MIFNVNDDYDRKEKIVSASGGIKIYLNVDDFNSTEEIVLNIEAKDIEFDWFDVNTNSEVLSLYIGPKLTVTFGTIDDFFSFRNSFMGGSSFSTKIGRAVIKTDTSFYKLLYDRDKSMYHSWFYLTKNINYIELNLWVYSRRKSRYYESDAYIKEGKDKYQELIDRKFLLE